MTHAAPLLPLGGQDHHVSVSVFGSVVVTVDGVAVDLGRRQVHRTVAALVVRSGQPISSDALMEHLWPAGLPARPRKALSVVLSRLRSALGGAADRLVTTDGGYRLVVDDVDVDRFVAAFELARAVEGEAAANALSDALDLWTGTPFVDEVDAPLLDGRRSSLEELRWFASVRLTELLVEQGRYAEAVVVSAPLIDEEIVRERVVVAHARALARSGRKSDALAVTGRAISALRQGQGLEPSSALLAAEHEILSGAVDLDPVAAKQHRPESDVFVGRRDELDALSSVESGRSLAVLGEAGLGKSSLLDRFVEDCASRGRQVIRVDVAPTPERPLDAIARLCLALAEGSDVAPDFRAALSRVCPELGLASGVAITRDAVIDDVTRFVEASVGSRVVLIDDAHWLDGGSAEVLEKLVARGRIALVVGMRPSDDPRLNFLQRHPAHLAELSRRGAARAGTCQAILLDPLDALAVRALVETVSGRVIDADAAERLVERSGGNALFLRLLVERGIEGGLVTDDLPSSVLVAVGERLDVVARPVLDTLDLAATIGSTFSVHTLRRLRPNADAHLDAAVSAGIVHVDRTTDTGHFIHALVSDVCSQLLAPGRRISLHDEIGRTLEIDGLSPGVFAPHYVASAPLDPHRAVSSSLAAAGDFIAGFDWQTAIDHIDGAAAVARDHGLDDPALLSQILVRRGAVGRALGRDDYAADLFRGCDLAREAGDDVLFVIGVTELCAHGLTTAAASADERVLALLDEALDLDIAPALRAELCASSVPLFSTSAEAERGRALFHEAWQLTSELADPDVAAAVVMHAHLGFGHPDDFEKLVIASQRLTALAGSDAEMIWEAAFIRFQCSVITGDAGAAHEAIDQMRLYTSLVVRRPRDFGLAFCESAHSTLTGDLVAAEAYANHAFAIGAARFDPSWATTIYGLLLLGIRMDQGRISEMVDAIDAMVDSQPNYPPFRAVAAMVATDAGDHAQARAHLDVIAADRFGSIVPDLHYTATLVLLASAVSAVGSPAEVEDLLRLLGPHAGRMSWNGCSSSGPVDGALALLARADGDQAGAERLESSAAEMVGRFRADDLVSR